MRAGRWVRQGKETRRACSSPNCRDTTTQFVRYFRRYCRPHGPNKVQIIRTVAEGPHILRVASPRRDFLCCTILVLYPSILDAINRPLCSGPTAMGNLPTGQIPRGLSWKCKDFKISSSNMHVTSSLPSLRNHLLEKTGETSETMAHYEHPDAGRRCTSAGTVPIAWTRNDVRL